MIDGQGPASIGPLTSGPDRPEAADTRNAAIRREMVAIWCRNGRVRRVADALVEAARLKPSDPDWAKRQQEVACRIAKYRKKIENRLLMIADPTDPDMQFEARVTASLRDAIDTIARQVRILAGSKVLSDAGMRLPVETAKAAESLRRAADDVETLLSAAKGKVAKGAPSVRLRDLPILWLAQCWQCITGDMPGLTDDPGGDSGPFARWATAALIKLDPFDNLKLITGRAGSAPTPIKDALLRLRDDDFLEAWKPQTEPGRSRA